MLEPEHSCSGGLVVPARPPDPVGRRRQVARRARAPSIRHSSSSSTSTNSSERVAPPVAGGLIGGGLMAGAGRCRWSRAVGGSGGTRNGAGDRRPRSRSRWRLDRAARVGFTEAPSSKAVADPMCRSTRHPVVPDQRLLRADIPPPASGPLQVASLAPRQRSSPLNSGRGVASRAVVRPRWAIARRADSMARPRQRGQCIRFMPAALRFCRLLVAFRGVLHSCRASTIVAARPCGRSTQGPPP